MNQKIKVSDLDEEIRIDKYLSELKDLELTRTKVQKLIDNDLILVNNKKIKNSYKVQNDDIIEIGALEEISKIIPEKMDLDIVYEDDDVIVVNKKSGVVVHPAQGNYTGTLVNGLLYHSKSLSKINGEFRPGIVHRIDKDTSGLILIAKNDKAHLSLSEQLKNKTTTRKYIALVEGVINHDTGTIDAPIGRDANDRKKMNVTSFNSKNAVTHFKVLEKYKNATLIECKLETGRTHQIRVHMKYIGHPVINDPVYGRKSATNFGQMLHAKTIGFIHPTTNEYLEFDCELPSEFLEMLKRYKEE